MGNLKWPEAETAGKAAVALKSVFILVVEAAEEVAAHCFVCVSVLDCTFANYVTSVCVAAQSIFFRWFLENRA